MATRQTKETKLYTIAVFSENQVGILNQTSIIFTRRGLNIESLSVSPSSIEGVHKFVITCKSDYEMMHRVVRLIEKRVDVLRAFLYTDEDVVYQEVALYKVPVEQLLDHTNVEQVIRNHNARILEITREHVVIEKTGHTEETQNLFEELKKYGILQFVRSGRVAVTRSKEEMLTQFLENHK